MGVWEYGSVGVFILVFYKMPYALSLTPYALRLRPTLKVDTQSNSLRMPILSYTTLE